MEVFCINRVVIEENILQHNIETIKKRIEDNAQDGKSPRIIAVIKGNAYGVGYGIMAQKLLENGIDFFAVSEVSEAIDVRSLGIDNDILVLNSTSIYGEARQIAKHNLIATIGSFDAFDMLNKIAHEENTKIRYHLKIDTGFSRFGFRYEDFEDKTFLDKLINTINSSEDLILEGTYTHFSESYSNDSTSTKLQFDRFLKCTNLLNKNGIDTKMCHCSNSSAFYKHPNMFLDAVRLGSAFLGRLQIGSDTGLKRLGYFESEICEIKELRKGNKIGYSGTCTLTCDSKIAIVEAGYNDGIFISGPRDSVRMIDKLRDLKKSITNLFKDGNKYVIINDIKVPILGRVGMKNFAIDISNIDCKVGDKVKIDVSLVLCNQKIERVMI